MIFAKYKKTVMENGEIYFNLEKTELISKKFVDILSHVNLTVSENRLTLDPEEKLLSSKLLRRL